MSEVASADRIRDPWGARTAYGPGERWPVRVDTQLAPGVSEADVERWVQSASVLHSNGDALDIAVKDGRIVGVRGRAVDRVNLGRLDIKDLYGWQALGAPDRLRTPLVRDGDRLVETDWDTAMGRIVDRSRRLLARPGGWGRHGFYTSGQLFLEEYYTLAVIGKAGIGTPTWTATPGCARRPPEQAIDPPGSARPDLDIFLDYAQRMDFRDRDGAPLIGWSDPESAFEAWKACSRGRPCDYTGITYARLRSGSGIQWPCRSGDGGTERLYGDGCFNTDPDYAETYGHDLASGAALTEEQYRAKEPRGRAILHAVDHEPGPEEPDGNYPLLLTTGRTIYHFHTRTKTGRVPELRDAAPDAWVELSPTDAGALGIAEGDLVRVESARGALEAPARITALRPGVVFVPFHYGDGDLAPGQTTRAANELTITAWDPVSKQPLYKVAAVRVTRIADGGSRPAPAPTVGAPAPIGSEPKEA